MALSAKVKSSFINSVCALTDRKFQLALAEEIDITPNWNAGERLSVAFVKQSSYVDLYTLPSRSELDQRRGASEIYCSSNFRSGPAGLLAQFDCDFYIVNCANTPETSIWEYRLGKEAGHDEVTRERRSKKRKLQESHSVDADSIDWSQYDIVVCMENAVPTSVTKKYPETVWATMLEWFGMPQYKRYIFRPPAGYDVFLTQFFSSSCFDRLLPASSLHWPYGFLHSSSFRELGLLDEVLLRDSIALDRNAESIVPELEVVSELASRVDLLGGLNIKDFAVRIARAKYYTSLGTSRLLWGNGTLDVAALGALILTDRSRLINPAVVAPECHVSNAKDLIEKIEVLNSDNDLYLSILDNQRRRLDYFAFWRPLHELYAYVRRYSRFATVAEKMEQLFVVR